MKIAGITYDSFVDGPGIRVVVFAQGCDLGCTNCHNPSSWDASLGDEYTPVQLVRAIKKPRPGRANTRGVTFSGGEPFMQAGELAIVAEGVRKAGMDVVTYTGHNYEELALSCEAGVRALLDASDFLVDGPYLHEERNLDLKFRGSANQRIIDLNATRDSGAVVLTEFE